MERNKLSALPVIIGVLTIIFSGCKKDGNESVNKLADIDGNKYDTVGIGNQIWMADNLKTTRYSNGEVIPKIKDVVQWTFPGTGAFCYYENNDANSKAYGNLYNWYAIIDNRNLCPAGWHIPSDSEWMTLILYLGGTDKAGGKLKEAGNFHWTEANGTTNASGFTALPGGFRDKDGFFASLNDLGMWWSGTQKDATNGSYFTMTSFSNSVFSGSQDKNYGYSVRCVKN